MVSHGGRYRTDTLVSRNATVDRTLSDFQIGPCSISYL